MELIEIERTPGFSNADGNISYKSANEAFMAYLKATGQKPSKENKKKFKSWLEAAKKDGRLEKLISKGKGAVVSEAAKELNKPVENHNADGDTKNTPAPAPEAKPKKILGMKPMVAIPVIIGSVALVSWGIYALVKRSKKGK